MTQHLQNGHLITHRGCHDGLSGIRVRIFLRTLTIHHLGHLHGNRTQAEVFADSIPIPFVQALCQVNLTNHGREHVRVLEVEVVVRTIEIGRHHSDVVGAVLEIERLTHLQTCNLGNGVWLVGVFERRSQQTILWHRLWGFTWIDAGGTEEEEFLHAMLPCLANHVLLNL